MITGNGKILKCTEDEMFEHYLDKGFDDIMSFDDFKRQCVGAGTQIVDKDSREIIIGEIIELLDELKTKLEKLI